MSRASDYFKYYRTNETTALVGDILLGKTGYISGGKAVGGGNAPNGSLTAFYRTVDATITPDDLTAWKTAFGRDGLIIGAYYPGAIPPTGGVFGLTKRSDRLAPTGETFNLTAR